MVTLEITEEERQALSQATSYALWYCPPSFRKALESLRSKAAQAKEQEEDKDELCSRSYQSS